MNTDTTPLTPTPPPPTPKQVAMAADDTNVESVTDLMALVNRYLPVGWAVEAFLTADGTIKVVPGGFEVRPKDGQFVTPGITLDGTHTLNTVVLVDALTIPDVYVAGWDLEATIENSVDFDEVIGDQLMYERGLSVYAPGSVSTVEDLYIEVDLTDVEIEVSLPLQDVLATPSDEEIRFDSVEEAIEQVSEALREHVANALGCNPDDCNVDISTDDIGL